MSCELDTFCQTTTHANKASTYQPFVQTQKRTCRGKMSRACMPEVLKLNKNTCICSGDLSQCACQKGYYWNMGACIACPTGSTTLEDGAVSLTSCTCMPGFVNTQPSNPAACEACGVGFFCNGESHRQACPANHTTEQDTSGNKSHCVCSTGVYLKDGSCTACPAGHFKIDVGNMPCQKCPHGRWSGVVGADTSLVCTACMAGATTQSSGATSVFECKCEPGLYGVNGSCMACIEGFYCPGTGEAVACPDGATSSRRASFPSDCICQPGRYAQGLSCTCALRGITNHPTATKNRVHYSVQRVLKVKTVPPVCWTVFVHLIIMQSLTVQISLHGVAAAPHMPTVCFVPVA